MCSCSVLYLGTEYKPHFVSCLVCFILMTEALALAERFADEESKGGNEAVLSTLHKLKHQFVALHHDLKRAPDGNSMAMRTLNSAKANLLAMKQRADRQYQVPVLWDLDT